MNNINIKVLLEKGENRLVKIRNCFNHETIITLSAFANSSGGKIIIGSEICPDEKSVDEMIDDWKSEIETNTDPEISFQVYNEKIETNTYILFSIDESLNKPVSCCGNYYYRKDDSDVKMNLNEKINMFNSF